jgi:hypothetical protein
MRTKLSEVPIELLRRAAMRLEALRGSVLGAGLREAFIGDLACPIYRPDLTDVAYWEFEILGLKGSGFIVASAGRHDQPLPHWSVEVEPPSRALEAKVPDGKVARVVKLDSLAYVAEDANGGHLAHIGHLPPKLPSTVASAKNLAAISTATAIGPQGGTDDGAPTELKVSSSGAPVPKLKLAGWKSRPALKAGYASAFKPHLAALAAHAAASWETDALLQKFGEGIYEGDQLTVPLLREGKARLSGDGAKGVRLSVLDRKSPAVLLDAVAIGRQGEASFQLDIEYADGGRESLAFFVIPRDAPSNFRSRLPNS